MRNIIIAIILLMLTGCSTTGNVVTEADSKQAADNYLLGVVKEYKGVNPNLVNVQRGTCLTCWTYIYEFEADGFDPGRYQVTIPVDNGVVGTTTILKMTTI